MENVGFQCFFLQHEFRVNSEKPSLGAHLGTSPVSAWLMAFSLLPVSKLNTFTD
jgi:hypothetical protein